jgi:hypothetical protein
LIDWTIDRDIALYFATYVGRDTLRCPRKTEGAMWICDPVPTGKVHQTLKLKELLKMMQHETFRMNAEQGCPLILHPNKQTTMLRASGQKPVYFSQMNFRGDLADAWCSVEEQSESAVFRKLILTDTMLTDSMAHLEKQGITEEYVYPE